MIQKLLTLSMIISYSSYSSAEVLTKRAEVYDLEGKKKHFDFERYRTGNGSGLKLKNVFKGTNGVIAVEEKATLENGELKSYIVSQKQTGESGEIKVEGQKINFIYRKNNGDSEKASEKLTPNFIIGMTLIPYLKKNWQSLLNGKSLRTRLGIWHRAETIGFKFWKEEDNKKRAKNIVVLVMKPTSFVIRALVAPLYLSFDSKTKEIISIKGRTSPKIKKDGEWKDFDAYIKYSTVK